MIIDIDKVKIPWLGRGRLVENFADRWAGGGDCRASGQDKAADAGDDERELHRYVPVAELANYSIFRAWKSSAVSQDSIFECDLQIGHPGSEIHQRLISERDSRNEPEGEVQRIALTAFRRYKPRDLGWLDRLRANPYAREWGA
jgi:hypothetical protein